MFNNLSLISIVTINWKALVLLDWQTDIALTKYMEYTLPVGSKHWFENQSSISNSDCLLSRKGRFRRNKILALLNSFQLSALGESVLSNNYDIVNVRITIFFNAFTKFVFLCSSFRTWFPILSENFLLLGRSYDDWNTVPINTNRGVNDHESGIIFSC